MGCPLEDGDSSDLIVAYTAGKLAPETEAEFLAHLAHCAQCRERAEAQQAVWSALDELPAVAVSPDFDEKLYRRIAIHQSRQWWRRPLPEHWSWRPAVPVAAACAVLAAAFLLKSPALLPGARPQNEPKLQIEQVEHALDDMDMLRQLSVDGQADKSRPSERI